VIFNDLITLSTEPDIVFPPYYATTIGSRASFFCTENSRPLWHHTNWEGVYGAQRYITIEKVTLKHKGYFECTAMSYAQPRFRARGYLDVKGECVEKNILLYFYIIHYPK